MEITILELVQRTESIEVVFTIIERLKNAKDLYSEVRNYKKEKFYKRVLCFLREIESVSESDRINFIKELKANPEDFWKNLLIKLEEMDEE
ncbi:MAG TPA: hypothetical protein DHV26_06140, partial [Cytophagales bacterium]|nr:hypothetical protein [Cytophagales bacterium]